MKQQRFSGYTMVVYCFLITMAVMGMGYLTLNIYVPVLLGELNTTTTVISTMFSILSGASMVASLVSGSVSAKIGLKRMIIVGVFCLLAGYVVLYFTTSVAMLFSAAALVGISLSWAGVICIGRIVPSWFIQRQGTMLGIVMAASGVGAMIASPIITALITNMGWRSTFLITLIAMAILTVPTALLLKEKPADVGQVPLGYDKNAQ